MKMGYKIFINPIIYRPLITDSWRGEFIFLARSPRDPEEARLFAALRSLRNLLMIHD